MKASKLPIPYTSLPLYLYTSTIWFYWLLICIASLFNKKAKLWITGRKSLFEEIERQCKNVTKIVWFHCASLGEFEQGRPVMEEFRKRYPDYKILLTFFSPSGYEVRKNYEGADFVFYLPIDTPGNVKRFLNLINPTAVFFIKYEFWFNYIINLRKRRIPFFIVSANFRKDQHFFKWYGGWFRKQLQGISHIFVQNELSVELLRSIGMERVSVSGDTRFDRVYKITQQLKTFPVVQQFCLHADIFIAGSSWLPDEELLAKLILSGKTNYKFIIAPHIIDKLHIASIVEKLGKDNVVLFSEADNENVKHVKVLLINCIGILSHLYQFGKIAYIGGGFGSGIHNILEAATFGMPVIFGPKYHKFREAIDLINEGGAFTIRNEEDFIAIVMKLYNDPLLLKQSAGIAKNFVQKNTGATGIIMKGIAGYLP